MLLLYVRLREHRVARLPDDHWRVQYTFLGTKVCRDAFMTLTGLSASVLHAARTDALTGKVSWSSRAERGLQGPGMLGNNKAAAYLGARQWLEWYADTHAEQSPMDGNAYLPAGREGYILERHGVTETDAEDASAYALASRRSKQARKARGGGEAEGASAYALASQRSAQTSHMADVPLAPLISDGMAGGVSIECEHVHSVQRVRALAVAD